MKALWKYAPENDTAGEPPPVLIMEDEDVEVLKGRGKKVAKESGSPDSRWVWGPNDRERCEMALDDGTMLIIK